MCFVSTPEAHRPRALFSVNPSVAKAGGCQSQSAKGEAVVIYCDPLATQDMGSSGFSDRKLCIISIVTIFFKFFYATNPNP
jgi:hypothetical protein